MPGGELVLARGGRVFGGERPRGSVVWGSGAYAGATGDFTASEEAGGRTMYTFRILTPEG